MSKTFGMETSFTYSGTPAEPGYEHEGYGSVEDFVDAVFDNLVELGCSGVNIILNKESHKMIVALSVVSEEPDLLPDTIVTDVFAKMRTAFHAAHGRTPGWSVPPSFSTMDVVNRDDAVLV